MDCAPYASFLFIKEDGQWKLYDKLFSEEKKSPYGFLPPPGTFENTDADWEKIPIFFRVPPESDLPFEKVKVTFDDLYVYFRFEFEDKLIPQGEIIDGEEFPETGNFSIVFDIDNNPETPEFIRGFEREIVFFIGEGAGAKNVDGEIKRYKFRSYAYHIKKYAENILGRLIFATGVLPIHSHIIIGDKSITLRAPREYLYLKEKSEVRIDFRYRGRVEASKVVVIP